jgi:mono/diheme cytochrome c family protein
MEKRKIDDEINFRDLLKSPQRLFGWIFVYFFLIVLGLGIFFGHNLIPISFNEQNVSATDLTNIKFDLEEKEGGITPAVELSSIKNPTQEMIAKGKELYDANCKSCHGENGMGDGPSGAVLNPKPRNFHDANGWSNGRSIEELYKTLQLGIINRGMAAYEYLSPADRFNIIHYIRTFAEFPPITSEQITQMNSTYNLSSGTVQPNQIPIDKAMSKILAEQASFQIKIESIKAKIFSESKSIGAKTLLKYSDDLDKSINIFLSEPFINISKFIQMIKTNPISIGLKSSIISATDNEIKNLFDYFRSVTT